MYFKTAEVAGFSVVYREAEDPSKPTIVMLFGFPSSSHPFHGLFRFCRVGSRHCARLPQHGVQRGAGISARSFEKS